MKVSDIKVGKYYKFLGYKVKCLSLEDDKIHIARVPFGIFRWIGSADWMEPLTAAKDNNDA